MRQKFFFLILAFLFMGTNLFAVDYYVNQSTGDDDTNNGLSSGAAFATLSKAISEADDGDEIIIVGTVSEADQISISGKNLTFQGQSDASIKRFSTGRTINVTGTTNLTFKNITFQNADAGVQGSVINTTINTVNLTFEDCLFQNNTNSNTNGSVVYIGNADATFTRCTFYNNTATASNGRGAAIIFGGSFTGTITNCTFYLNKLTLNTSVSDGAAITTFNSGASQQLTVTNSLFSDNTNSAGDKLDIACAGSSNLTIVNSLAESITQPTTFINTASEIAADFTSTNFSFVSPSVEYTAASLLTDATPIDFGNDNSDAGAWDSNINLFETGSDWAAATNWSSTAIPLATDNVTLLSDSPALVVSATTGAVANDLSVNASSSLAINSGGSLIVNGSSSGDVTYNRNLGTENWYLVSSPVSGEIMTDMRANNSFADGTGGSRIGFAPYTTASDSWNYFTTSSVDALVSGKGYSAKLSTDGDISFTGNINTTDVTVSVVTSGAGGFNLLGNPYTSHINSATFLTENTSNLVTQNIWVWNQATENYEVKATTDAFVLAPSQGFFVRASSDADLNFIKTNQADNGGTFQKSSKTEVKLMMNDGNSNRFAKLYYLENVTKGFDNGFDGETFGGIENSVDVYTNLLEDNQGKKYQVQSLPISEIENMVIPLGVKAASGKEITFTAEAMNLPNGVNVFLEDRNTNTITLLNEANASYKVTLNEDTNDVGRFYVHTTSDQVLSAAEVLLENISIYATNSKTLRMIGLPTGSSSVKLFNILGEQVMQSRFISTGMKEISLPKLTTGVYFVHVNTEAGKLNKKIVIE